MAFDLVELSELTGVSVAELKGLQGTGEIPARTSATNLNQAVAAVVAAYKKIQERGPRFKTATEMSSVTGIPMQAIRAARSAGADILDGRKVSLYKFLRWYFTSGETNEALDLERERARLARAQAERIELKNGLLKCELISLDEHETALRRVLEPVRDRMLGLESLSTKCTDSTAARVVLSDYSRDTLEMLLKIADEMKRE